MVLLNRSTDQPMRPRYVMIAEDNVDNADVISEMLEFFGYRHSWVVNGKELLDSLQDEVPDLILMDIDMPDMDGIEALQRIQANPKFRSITIVAMSGGIRGTSEQSISLGFADFLAKPFSLRKLRELLEKFLGESQGISEVAESPLPASRS